MGVSYLLSNIDLCRVRLSRYISQYLRTVNGSQFYNIARLCTDDPISVSRQFSYKFHDFFNIVIMKWAVLGTVDHYYWKEYQMRGYHIVLWIRDRPVLGRDSPEKVLSFIQERIICHIPDSKTSPDLHALVTKYQMHKRNPYCKRNLKFGKTYVSRCRFDFLDRKERWLGLMMSLTV